MSNRTDLIAPWQRQRWRDLVNRKVALYAELHEAGLVRTGKIMHDAVK